MAFRLFWISSCWEVIDGPIWFIVRIQRALDADSDSWPSSNKKAPRPRRSLCNTNHLTLSIVQWVGNVTYVFFACFYVCFECQLVFFLLVFLFRGFTIHVRHRPIEFEYIRFLDLHVPEFKDTRYIKLAVNLPPFSLPKYLHGAWIYSIENILNNAAGRS